MEIAKYFGVFLALIKATILIMWTKMEIYKNEILGKGKINEFDVFLKKFLKNI